MRHQPGQDFTRGGLLIAPLSGAGELASLMTNAGVGRLDGARDYGDKREAVIKDAVINSLPCSTT